MTVTPQTNVTLSELAQELLAHDNYVIAGHVSPDGDCIGSQLSLMHALRGLGKNVRCVLAGDTNSLPRSLRFLPGAEEMVPASEIVSTDSFIGVDVPNQARMGEEAAQLHAEAGFTATLDHHANPERVSDVAFVDPDAASTTVLVWELIAALGHTPTKEEAVCAYTGLATDTGRFAYQNADPRAFRAAACMIEAGVNVSEVYNAVFASRSLAAAYLEARALQRMELLMGGALAVSFVTLEDFEEAHAVKADADNVINALRSLEGVRVACVVRETEENVRGSLRSKDDTDISIFARSHNGGGHKAASGMTLFGDIHTVFGQIKTELVEYLQEQWNWVEA